MSNVPRNIDEQIREAMQRGDFKNLPGRGKPLDLSQNPHEDPGWRTAYRMLKENGYTLPWIETRRKIELDFEKAIKLLEHQWAWHQQTQSGQDLTVAERDWQRALVNFREQINDLNKRIRSYNLEAPATQFQRRQIHAEREINKITGSPD